MADPKGPRQLLLRTVEVTPVDSPAFLIVEVEITDAEAGAIDFRFPGWYVASLAARLQALRDAHPELCGQVGTQVETLNWSASVDPSKISQN